VAVQSKRNKHAALKLMRKLLKKYAFAPERLVTDDLRSLRPRCGDRGRCFRANCISACGLQTSRLEAIAPPEWCRGAALCSYLHDTGLAAAAVAPRGGRPYRAFDPRA
jgi:hypothetical protein